VYCPNGPLQPPDGGMRNFNSWAPIGGEGANMWINIGNQNSATELCKDHYELGKGNPEWGLHNYQQLPSGAWSGSDFKRSIYCCWGSDAPTFEDPPPTEAPTTLTPTTAKPTTATPTLPPGPIALVRKVRVQLDGKNFLHMKEVQVFNANGVNVALNKRYSTSQQSNGTATQSSTFSGAGDLAYANKAINNINKWNDFSMTNEEEGT